MRVRGGSPVIVAVLLGLAGAGVLLHGAGNEMAQAQIPAQKAPEEQYPKLIRSVEGPDLFRAYCGSCHGLDAKGHGPAATALKEKVPDLTVLAQNNGGRFPEKQVRSTIMGDDALPSHGSREMPVWGPIFHQVEWDVDRGNVREENLVKYLESIQSIRAKDAPAKKEEGNSLSGEQLYRRNCAVCHGNDLKGMGPAPYPFKDVTPDLTTLAKRNGGEFPDDYFEGVMRNGVTLPAHGPAEMPVWGAEFRAEDRLDAGQMTLRIERLKNYIKSLQTK
ncbi:MAG TPA: c-type cytochrome [Candidatus Limnocylindrales bacterium]|nr:c-type cytochrome [Candidatus Limnocylindrales bacterium]